jgi:hypothetical protein
MALKYTIASPRNDVMHACLYQAEQAPCSQLRKHTHTAADLCAVIVRLLQQKVQKASAPMHPTSAAWVTLQCTRITSSLNHKVEIVPRTQIDRADWTTLQHITQMAPLRSARAPFLQQLSLHT